MYKLVLFYSGSGSVSYDDLRAIDQRYRSDLIAVVAAEISGVPTGMRVCRFGAHPEGMTQLALFAATLHLEAVVFRQGGFESCPADLKSFIFSKSAPTVQILSGGKLSLYSSVRWSSTAPRILFVYPGPLFPVNNGSRQRALDFLLQLHRANAKISVLSPEGSVPPGYRDFLNQLGIEFRTYRQNRLVSGVIGRLRKLGKWAVGKDYYLPLYARLNSSLSRSYQQSVNSFDCDIVIFSYVWMVPWKLKKAKPTVYTVDLHDINFVRDRGFYRPSNVVRNILESLNQRIEYKLLNQTDLALAISNSDAKSLVPDQLRPPVLTVPPSFSWIVAPSFKLRVKAERFGFIGANMSANRAAIDYVMQHIWPLILKRRPNSKFFVAGDICNHIARSGGFGPRCFQLGFVPSLSDFYGGIDALISPVFIQGGINFKVLEALVSGVPVMVNETGIKSVPSNELTFVIRSSELEASVDEFLAFVDNAFDDPDSLTRRVEQLRARLMADFERGIYSAFPQLRASDDCKSEA
ncbi:glycosyltransferase [Chthonobacter rhizosphaerae]|uniref:glycosyltransferase n=1 Tax=Chthonobacter rhizosphaerae TaxID=2735553 RepID=UPI0015EF331B|nr:glycosyltransferase [Chthonobacter rhizosphaerae]